MKLQILRRCIPLLLVLVVTGYSAQTQEDCPALVQKALESVTQSCGDLGRNVACYGNTRIEAAFDQAVELTFSQPADQVPVNELRSLHTFPLDEQLGLWGVAVMNVQANLPDTLPGQAVRFVLYGDVNITNAGQSLPDVAACPAITTARINLRSGPGTEYNVVTAADAGTEFDVIGRNEDASWLFANVNGQPGWMSAEFVTTNCDLMATIPVRDPEQNSTYGPMQAFYFTTGVGEPACNEVPPSSLVIQSPQGYVVNLSVNGVDVAVSSTVSFTAPEGENLNIATLEGKAIVSEGDYARAIPEGFEMSIPLSEDEDGNLQPASSFGALDPINPDDYNYFDEFPEGFWEHAVEVPDTTGWQDFDAFCADPENEALCSDPLFTSGFYVCGDSVCDAYEYCPDDCGNASCGDGYCDPFYLGEDVETCAEDCETTSYCGDYYCDFNEDESTCPNDCAPKETAICGDYVCDEGEDSDTCPTDCGALSCGDFVCDPTNGENENSCPQDCSTGGYCGDFVCDPSLGEDEDTCFGDCYKPSGYCGDSVCDVSLGEDSSTCANDCGGGSGRGYCGDFVCDPNLGEDSNTCANDCGGGSGYCGDFVCDGGLGEDSNTCANDCGSGGGGGYCGDFVCDPNLGEDSNTCANDCGGGGGGYCGDFVCEGGLGEDLYTCGVDCGYCGDFYCDAGLGEDNGTCSTDCP